MRDKSDQQLNLLWNAKLPNPTRARNSVIISSSEPRMSRVKRVLLDANAG